MSPRRGVAILGGTFDHLHRGHRRLIAEAFAAAEEVRVGLTTARYLREHEKPRAGRLQSYAKRHRELVQYLRRAFPGRTYSVVPLNDMFGGSLAPDLDVLVVSEETKRAAETVNLVRGRLARRPLAIRVVPEEFAEDHLPIQSRRIREGAIDVEGRSVRGPRALVIASGLADRLVAQSEASRVFRPLRLRFLTRPPAVLSSDLPEFTLRVERGKARRNEEPLRVSVSSSDGGEHAVAGHVRPGAPLPAALVREALRPWGKKGTPVKRRQ